jgi:uncharacterized membrane protein (GlpM family)
MNRRCPEGEQQVHNEFRRRARSGQDSAEDDVTKHLAEWCLKALAGGLLVVAFAVAAQMINPKRLSGILSAAPSVALGSLIVTLAFKGPHDARLAALGMALGAIAFTVYCLAVVPSLARWGGWRGSGAALVAWFAVAFALLWVVPG